MALVAHAGPDRHRRNSAYRSSPDGVISSLRLAIRACENTHFSFIPNVSQTVQFHQDTIPLKRGYSKPVRRVSMFEHRYRVGWVVDADFHNCMNCLRPFGWLRARPKHHCRACGALVCHDCSPFVALIPHVEEERGSRVCRSCFGLKPGLISPMTASPSPMMNPEASMYYVPPTQYDYLPVTQLFASPNPNPNANTTSSSQSNALTVNNSMSATGNRKYGYTNHTADVTSSAVARNGYRGSNRLPNPQYTQDSVQSTSTNPHRSMNAPQYVAPSTTASLAGSVYGSGNGRVRRRTKLTPRKEAENAMIRRYIEEMEAFEQDQKPKYEEAYRKMRELIPLDIHKSSLKGLVEMGITAEAAARIWNNKILWLIVTHPTDIAKIHLADFRSKYTFDGMDIVEMRAVWNILPVWEADSTNPLERGKAEWKEGFKSKLDDLVYKELGSDMPAHLQRNAAYTDADFLHLFDPDVDIRPRFHRSASFKQEAQQSPMPDGSMPSNGNGTGNSDNLDDLYNLSPLLKASPNPAYATAGPKSTLQDRKSQYLDNFKSPDLIQQQQADQKDKKYRTLLEEINQSDEEDNHTDLYDIYGLGDSPVTGESPSPNRLSRSGVTMRSANGGIASRPSTLEDFDEVSSMEDSVSILTPQPRPVTRAEYDDPHTAQTPFPSQSTGSKLPFSPSGRVRFSTPGSAGVGFARERSASPLPSPNSHSGSGGVDISRYPRHITHQQQQQQAPPAPLPEPPFVDDSRHSSFSTLSNFSIQRSYSEGPANVSAREIPLVPGPAMATGSTRTPLMRTLSERDVDNENLNYGSYRDDLSFLSARQQERDEQLSQILSRSLQSRTLHMDRDREQSHDINKTTEKSGESTDRKRERLRELQAKPIHFPAVTPRQHSSLPPNFASSSAAPAAYSAAKTPAMFTPATQSPMSTMSGFSVESLQSTNEAYFTPFRGPANATSSSAHPDTDKSLSYRHSLGNMGGAHSHHHVHEQHRHHSPQPQPPQQQQSNTRDRQVESASTEDSHESRFSSSSAFTSVATPQSFVFLNSSRDFGRLNNGIADDVMSPLTPLREETASEKHTSLVVGSPDDSSTVLTDHSHLFRSKKKMPLPTTTTTTTTTSTESTATVRTVDDILRSQPSSPAQNNGIAELAKKKKPLPTPQQLTEALWSADILLVLTLLDGESLTSVFTTEDMNDLYWTIAVQCVKSTKSLKESESATSLQDVLLFMIDDGAVNVNTIEPLTGQTLLHACVTENAERLGRELIKRNADILLMDFANQCPLSLFLMQEDNNSSNNSSGKECEEDWLLDEFESSGKEMKLLAFGSAERKLRYFSYFVLTGQSIKARELIQSGHVKISKAEATELMNSCKGNFDSMTDPVDTFELLSSLGAELE